MCSLDTETAWNCWRSPSPAADHSSPSRRKSWQIDNAACKETKVTVKRNEYTAKIITEHSEYMHLHTNLAYFFFSLWNMWRSSLPHFLDIHFDASYRHPHVSLFRLLERNNVRDLQDLQVPIDEGESTFYGPIVITVINRRDQSLRASRERLLWTGETIATDASLTSGVVTERDRASLPRAVEKTRRTPSRPVMLTFLIIKFLAPCAKNTLALDACNLRSTLRNGGWCRVADLSKETVISESVLFLKFTHSFF